MRPSKSTSSIFFASLLLYEHQVSATLLPFISHCVSSIQHINNLKEVIRFTICIFFTPVNAGLFLRFSFFSVGRKQTIIVTVCFHHPSRFLPHRITSRVHLMHVCYSVSVCGRVHIHEFDPENFPQNIFQFSLNRCQNVLPYHLCWN